MIPIEWGPSMKDVFVLLGFRNKPWCFYSFHGRHKSTRYLGVNHVVGGERQRRWRNSDRITLLLERNQETMIAQSAMKESSNQGILARTENRERSGKMSDAMRTKAQISAAPYVSSHQIVFTLSISCSILLLPHLSIHKLEHIAKCTSA